LGNNVRYDSYNDPAVKKHKKKHRPMFCQRLKSNLLSVPSSFCKSLQRDLLFSLNVRGISFKSVKIFSTRSSWIHTIYFVLFTPISQGEVSEYLEEWKESNPS
jgi:hypothetical protein